MKYHADPTSLAASDLMIARLRDELNLPFDSSENTPPELLNSAYLFGKQKYRYFDFAAKPVERSDFLHSVGKFHVYSNDQGELQRVRSTLDLAWCDFIKWG